MNETNYYILKVTKPSFGLQKIPQQQARDYTPLIAALAVAALAAVAYVTFAF